MSFSNYLICQKCQKNIPLYIIFFDVEGLKIQYKCKCMAKYNIISGNELVDLMNSKKNLIKGNCQENKNHINIPGQMYCYSCNRIFCAECEKEHYIEFNNDHNSISNNIEKVIYNYDTSTEKNIEEKDYKVLEEKIRIKKEYIEANNKKLYEEIINIIKEKNHCEKNKYKRYEKIINKSYNFNKSTNDLIYSLFLIFLSNYIALKKYNLKEPSINLFSNFIINNNNLKDFKNLNFLEKISLYNNCFLNNFIIKKKLIYPEITCLATLKSHISSIDCIVQLYDGRIATGSSDGSVKIWNQNDYSLIKTLDLEREENDPIYSIHQMTNNYLIYGTEGGNFCIWDINSYQIITTIENCHLKSVWGFMNAGKNKIVSISEDETFKIWNINNFKLIKSININEGMILSEWTAKDGSLITGCENGKILIWDMNDYSCFKELKGHNSGVDYIIQLSDYRIVSGAQDNNLKIWDYFSGECLGTLKGHSSAIETLLELKDTRVVSGSWDQTLKIWDIYNYQCLSTIKAHNDYILVIELLKDGKFASGSADNTLKIWKPIYNDKQIIKIND